MPPQLARPSKLATILARLNRSPPPKLSPSIVSLSLSLADRNAHYGARHFLKEELPRISYVNPNLKVQVTRKEHKKDTPWPPEMKVELGNGTTTTIDMTQKHSSAILRELLNTGASSSTASS